MIIFCKKYNFPCRKRRRRFRGIRHVLLSSEIDTRLRKGVVWMNYTLQFGGRCNG